MLKLKRCDISRLFIKLKVETDNEMDSDESSRSPTEFAGQTENINYSNVSRQNVVTLPAGVCTYFIGGVQFFII